MFTPSPEALELLQKRYFWPGEDWEKMCKRVAKAVANNEEQEEIFFKLMFYGIFLPNTPCLVNAGRATNWSACFVVPILDDLNNIFETLKSSAAIFKTGGGVGINFSTLRPENAPLKSGGISSGPISFMKIFDTMIEQIKAGGVRRGAMMSLLSIEHPDVVKFIKCKDQDGILPNMNVSIMMTDQFMKAVVEKDPNPWQCHFGRDHYWISNKTDEPMIIPTKSAFDQLYSAPQIWDLICKYAHKNGEPGLLFIDEAKRKNGPDIVGCNPCGEVVGEAWDACNLGSIDLSKLVNDNTEFVFSPDGKTISFGDVVRWAVDFLNNVINKSVFPLPQIDKQVKESRKIGLGVMGFADLLLSSGIKYGSQKSYEFGGQLMRYINAIARERADEQMYRNDTVTCIAPTGSISMIAGCSSGIEPIYKFETKTNRKDFGEKIIRHPKAAPILAQGSSLPPWFVDAHQVTPEEHVRMQATFQQYTELSISKTVNLSNDATVEQVAEVYKLAWTLHCKGVTVYRDGSRQNQVLSDASKSCTLSEPTDTTAEARLSVERPYCLNGKTYKLKLNLGGKVQNVYINVTANNNGQPYEVFLFGNVRELEPGAAQAVDIMTRLISLCLRGGVPVDKVITQLEKVPCGNIYSLPHKIATVLREYLPEGTQGMECPECGAEVAFVEKCMKCTACGWSKCH